MCMRERSGTGTFRRGRVDLGQAHFGEDALTADRHIWARTRRSGTGTFRRGRVDQGQAHLGEDALIRGQAHFRADASIRDRHISAIDVAGDRGELG